MTIATDIIAYLSTLQLAGGDHDGELFKVLPWERKFVKGCFSQSDAAAISVARGGGKSALVAGLACAVLDPDGPLHGSRRDADVFAASFDGAGIIYEDVLSMMGSKYDIDDRAIWRKQHSRNAAILQHKASGARVRCHGSDPSKAHGLRSYLALMDEPAQWDTAKRDRMRAAIGTGLGKHPGSRLIALGTKPRDRGHWFALMLQGIACGYAQVHAAPKSDPPFQRRTWLKANPSLNHLPSLELQIRIEAKAAQKNPDDLAIFKALRLNQGGSEVLESVLLDADVWEGIEGDAERQGRPVWGIDLGTTAALSAIAAYWPQTGRLASLCAFPSAPDLRDRGISDGVGRLYTTAFERGELILTEGFATNIAQLLTEALQRFGAPSAIVCDRWREGELRDSLKAAKVPPCLLEVRGMGFKDGAADVRVFRRAVLEGDVTPVKSLLLASCMAEARVKVDPSGNAKLAKATEAGRRLKARDDAAAASIISVALGHRTSRKDTGAAVYMGAA